ncbi:MAG: hypothetical protein ACFE8B_16650, partial [Candidatus Hermodarchaeota archaeon]
MSKNRNQAFLLIFIFAVFAIQVPILLSLGAEDKYENIPSQNVIPNVDELKFSFPNNLKSSEISSSSSLNTELSIFDDSLKQDLISISANTEISMKDSKVIILFEEHLDPLRRELIINSLFEEFTIIKHYDILSGTYIKVNPLELLSKESDLTEIEEIKRIYKSETYESPYIIDNNLQLSALNQNIFPNWWLSAIGADNLVYDGSGVRVAVIDTGIYDHPALNIVDNQNFVTD